MDLFYATTNSSKIYNMRRRLEGTNIHIVTPVDIGLHIEVDENGTTPIENALSKARAYYSKTNLPTIAGDSALYIRDVPEEDQPGLFVRRVHGKTLNNDEMIEHYSNLAKKYGGIIKVYYLTGLALIIDGDEYTIELPDDDFLIIDQPNENKTHKGNPLDVIAIDPYYEKYMNELTDDEAKRSSIAFDQPCVQFLMKHLN